MRNIESLAADLKILSEDEYASKRFEDQLDYEIKEMKNLHKRIKGSLLKEGIKRIEIVQGPCVYQLNIGDSIFTVDGDTLIIKSE